MIYIPWNIVEGTEILYWYLNSKYQFLHLFTSCLQMPIAFNLHWPRVWFRWSDIALLVIP